MVFMIIDIMKSLLPLLIGGIFLGSFGVALGAICSVCWIVFSTEELVRASLWMEFVRQGMDKLEAYNKTNGLILPVILLNLKWGVAGAIPAMLLRFIFKKRWGFWKAFLTALGSSFLLLVIQIAIFRGTFGGGITFCISMALLWKGRQIVEPEQK